MPDYPPFDLYDELEVSPAASTEVIRAAFRSLISRYHPDRNPDAKGATAKTQRINQAYFLLENAELRAPYDAHRAAAKAQGQAAAQAWAAAQEQAAANVHAAKRESEDALKRQQEFERQQEELTKQHRASAAAGAAAENWERERAGSPSRVMQALIMMLAGWRARISASGRSSLLATMRLAQYFVVLVVLIFLVQIATERGGVSSSSKTAPPVHQEPAVASTAPDPTGARPPPNVAYEAVVSPVTNHEPGQDSARIALQTEKNGSAGRVTGVERPPSTATEKLRHSCVSAIGGNLEALALFNSEATRGAPSAQQCLGEVALGMRDYEAANRWFTECASTRAGCQNGLGYLYVEGLGVPQDFVRAAKYFAEAMSNGDTKARVNLAEMYFRGDGVPKNLPEARRLAYEASRAATPGSRELLAQIESANSK